MEHLPYYHGFQFFRHYLDHMRLPYSRISSLTELINSADMNLRNQLGIAYQTPSLLEKFLRRIIKENTIAHLTDEFMCQYIAFSLPGEKTNIMVIGPYMTNSLTIEQCMEIMAKKAIPSQWLPIIKGYYQKLTMIDESGLVASLFTLGDLLWGEENYRLENFIQGLPNTISPVAVPLDPQKRLDAFSNSKFIEQIYDNENALLQAISHGRSSRAKAILGHFSEAIFEQRVAGIRNAQNYSIVVNTLFRKAVEQGGVHPLYIDQLSSSFAHRIESTNRPEAFPELWSDMVQKYCALVNKHSIRNYSLPIQKVITRIDFDLTADLSLKATAHYLNVNASYLSNLFKKETGYTLSDYVNMKRTEHAVYLLCNTQLSISSIAQGCGILDDNYFTKLFKKYQGMTPTQFRQNHFYGLGGKNKG